VLSFVSLALLLTTAACPKPISRRTGPFAPTTPGYTYQNGAVLHDGKPEYQIVEHDVDVTTTQYEVHGTDGALEVSAVMMSSAEGTLELRAEFPTLGVNYDVRTPSVPFTDVIASYIDHGVLVAGHVQKDGLAAYAQGKGIALVDTAAQIHRMDAAADQHACAACTQAYRKCQVDQANERATPGLHVQASCESQYQTCSQGGIKQDESWPCGQPTP
jgi:hypothetical protein